MFNTCIVNKLLSKNYLNYSNNLGIFTLRGTEKQDDFKEAKQILKKHLTDNGSYDTTKDNISDKIAQINTALNLINVRFDNTLTLLTIGEFELKQDDNNSNIVKFDKTQLAALKEFMKNSSFEEANDSIALNVVYPPINRIIKLVQTQYNKKKDKLLISKIGKNAIIKAFKDLPELIQNQFQARFQKDIGDCFTEIDDQHKTYSCDREIFCFLRPNEPQVLFNLGILPTDVSCIATNPVEIAFLKAALRESPGFRQSNLDLLFQIYKTTSYQDLISNPKIEEILKFLPNNALFFVHIITGAFNTVMKKLEPEDQLNFAFLYTKLLLDKDIETAQLSVFAENYGQNILERIVNQSNQQIVSTYYTLDPDIAKFMLNQDISKEDQKAFKACDSFAEWHNYLQTGDLPAKPATKTTQGQPQGAQLLKKIVTQNRTIQEQKEEIEELKKEVAKKAKKSAQSTKQDQDEEAQDTLQETWVDIQGLFNMFRSEKEDANGDTKIYYDKKIDTENEDFKEAWQSIQQGALGQLPKLLEAFPKASNLFDFYKPKNEQEVGQVSVKKEFATLLPFDKYKAVEAELKQRQHKVKNQADKKKAKADDKKTDSVEKCLCCCEWYSRHYIWYTIGIVLLTSGAGVGIYFAVASTPSTPKINNQNRNAFKIEQKSPVADEDE